MIKLRNDGTLQEMYQHGLISHKPIFYLDIVMELESKHLTQIELSRRLGVSRMTIQRAVKTFS
jgi:predicted transcriptional regulator